MATRALHVRLQVADVFFTDDDDEVFRRRDCRVWHQRGSGSDQKP